MIRNFLVIMTVVASLTDSAKGSPHSHDDPYRQYERLLKEARKAEKHRQLYGDYYQGASQNQNFQLQQRPGSGSGGSPPNPILTPGNGGTVGSAIPGRIPPAGGPSSNYPPILPNFPSGSQIAGQIGLLPRPTLPPYPVEQVNRGVSTILNGVRSLDLGQILRGAFVFPRNENVRSVANNVIDSIFGAARPSGGARI